MEPSRDVRRLIEIMAALRTPGSGCPWDLQQTFATIAPYTIEEAYEVADAIEREDPVDLCEELGDLLLQVVFHAQMAKEASLFDFDDVVETLTKKLIRRHPHVFGNTRSLSPEGVKTLWADIKAAEKREKAAARASAGLSAPANDGALSGVPLPLPALTRALKLQQKAGKVGFDWNDARAVLAKLREETEEIDEALSEGDASAIKDEIGDLLFVVVNLARHADVDPEQALRGCNAKFERRFAHIESELAAQGRAPSEASLSEMDALWNEAKRVERTKKRAAGG
jgi:nucleoside triphosphate diphosphatase